MPLDPLLPHGVVPVNLEAHGVLNGIIIFCVSLVTWRK